MRRVGLARDNLGPLGFQQVEFGSALSIGKNLPQLAHARNHAFKSLVKVGTLLRKLKRRRLNVVERRIAGKADGFKALAAIRFAPCEFFACIVDPCLRLATRPVGTKMGFASIMHDTKLTQRRAGRNDMRGKSELRERRAHPIGHDHDLALTRVIRRFVRDHSGAGRIDIDI